MILARALMAILIGSLFSSSITDSALQLSLQNSIIQPPTGGGPPSSGMIERWMNLTSTLSTIPQSRGFTSMVYDPADGYQVLFGGQSKNGPLGDTWKFQNGAWTNITSSTLASPAPRFGASIAYDTVQSRVTLFGGSTLLNGQDKVYGDTWAFSKGTWKQLCSDVSPAPRSGASLTFDQTDGYAILFGGNNGPTYYQDTWKFEAGVWTELSPSNHPTGRAWHGMTYDPADHYLLMFGGRTSNNGIPSDLNDTWKFAGGSWAQLFPIDIPAGRENFGMTYDSTTRSVLLFGGNQGACGVEFGDTWEFTTGDWMKDYPLSSPSGRHGFALSYNPATGTLMLFGGTLVTGANPPDTCAQAEFQRETWDFTTLLEDSANNWAGYAIAGLNGSVSDVKGSWVIPAVVGTCPPKDLVSAFWVGIDGFNSSTVEQAGTVSACKNGHPEYFAWFEFFPLHFHRIGSLKVRPGDVISADVKYDEFFTISIVDHTTGETFSESAIVPSAARSSAEWIAEAPLAREGIIPLVDFGVVKFGVDNSAVSETCSVTMNGTRGPIGLFSPIQQIVMVSSSGIVKAQSSDLSIDGTSFSVFWRSEGP